MAILITNIKELVNVRATVEALRGEELSVLPKIENAFLIIEEDTISGYGAMQELKYEASSFRETYNAKNRIILPSWCDSHTHLVYTGSRENEFVDKIKGLNYTDIAAKGGGILASAARIAAISEEELFNESYKRLQEVILQGTGAIEIKSGYGLSVEGELKMLRVIKRLKQYSKIAIKATFLGAHAFPIEFRDHHPAYIDLIKNVMLPKIDEEGLADFIDVFCEKNFFSPQQMEEVCVAGQAFGLKPKPHINQLNSIGGLQKAVQLGALSVDHLETMTDEDISLLSSSSTIGTLLPTAAFFLRMPYQPARKLIDAGCAIALASDYNPGSSPSGNMNFVVALSCIQMRMLPEEAINAATINGACAMGLQNEVGSVAIGKKANLLITKPVPSLPYLPYSFGSDYIDKIMVAGEWVD